MRIAIACSLRMVRHARVALLSGVTTIPEMVAIVEEEHRLGMKVAAHATGTWGRSMKTAIQAGVDTIEHVDRFPEEAVFRAPQVAPGSRD